VAKQTLFISRPSDPDEQEAERVSERVLRLPAPPSLSLSPATTPPIPRIHRWWEQAGEAVAPVSLRDRGDVSTRERDPAALVGALRGGRALSPKLRADFEPRFGLELSQVRVHTDGQAADAARALGALAFTFGRDVVFGAGQYRPETVAGRRLLAHELTHVVQQGAGRSPAGKVRLQRACPPAPSGLGASPPAESCERRGPGPVAGERFDFCQDSDQLADGQEARLAATIAGARRAVRVEVHGYASVEGPTAEYNYNLSCRRAVAVASRFRAGGIGNVFVVMHGPTSTYPNVAFNRNVTISIEQPAAPPPPPAPTPQQQAAALADADCAAITRLHTARRLDTVGLFLQIYRCLTCSFGREIRAGRFAEPLWIARVNHATFQRLLDAFASPNAEYQRAFIPCNILDRCLFSDLGFIERMGCEGVVSGTGPIVHLQLCTENIGGVHLRVDLRDALRTVGCATPTNKRDYAQVIPLFQSCNRAILSSEFPIGGETVAEQIAIPRITEQRNAAWTEAGCPP